jgi:hypothetical protein
MWSPTQIRLPPRRFEAGRQHPGVEQSAQWPQAIIALAVLRKAHEKFGDTPGRVGDRGAGLLSGLVNGQTDRA